MNRKNHGSTSGLKGQNAECGTKLLPLLFFFFFFFKGPLDIRNTLQLIPTGVRSNSVLSLSHLVAMAADPTLASFEQFNCTNGPVYRNTPGLLIVLYCSGNSQFRPTIDTKHPPNDELRYISKETLHWIEISRPSRKTLSTNRDNPVLFQITDMKAISYDLIECPKNRPNIETILMKIFKADLTASFIILIIFPLLTCIK